MSIEGQGHSFTIYFPGFVCFVLYLDKISGERLQDHWSSGFKMHLKKFLKKHTQKIEQQQQQMTKKACKITQHANDTVIMIQSFRTDRSGQTVQTQIRLLLEAQSDQGLHCLLFHLRLFDKIP